LSVVVKYTMAPSTQLKQTVNVTSKRWWIQYSQGFIITAIVVIFLSAMTGNMRDIGIGVGVLVLFTGIGLFTSSRKYGFWNTITSGPAILFGSPSIKQPNENNSFDSTFDTSSGH